MSNEIKAPEKPKRRDRETLRAFRRRLKLYDGQLDKWKLDQAVARTNMRASGHERNKLWRIAAAEREMTIDEEDIW